MEYTNINATKRVAAQIRFRYYSNRFSIAGASVNPEANPNSNISYKFSRELDDFYYIDKDENSVITRQSATITQQNYVGRKIESVRINATTNYKITSGLFKIYGRVRSKY